MKTYLHNAVKIPQFLSHGKIQKHVTSLQNIVAFSTKS